MCVCIIRDILHLSRNVSFFLVMSIFLANCNSSTGGIDDVLFYFVLFCFVFYFGVVGSWEGLY